MDEKGRREVHDRAKELGWTIVLATKRRPYDKLLCTCGGKHKKWLHKTPSNPNHYKEAIAFMQRACSEAKVIPIEQAAKKQVRKPSR